MFFNYRREPSSVVDLFVWLSLALTLVSAGDYLLKLRQIVNEGTTGH